MTDRHRTLIVVLEQDTRSDDIEEYRKVFLSHRGVERVELGSVVTGTDHLERSTLAWKLARDLHEFLAEWLKKNR